MAAVKRQSQDVCNKAQSCAVGLHDGLQKSDSSKQHMLNVKRMQNSGFHSPQRKEYQGELEDARAEAERWRKMREEEEEEQRVHREKSEVCSSKRLLSCR